jgi:hypothetical protein
MKSYDAAAETKRQPGRHLGHPDRRSRLPGLGLGRRAGRGQHRAREKIKVVSKANPGRAFPVKGTEFTPGQRMTWSGGVPLGLFKGVRTFTLAPVTGRHHPVHHAEEYTGPLLPLIWRSMPDLGASFRQFASGLKARAER